MKRLLMLLMMMAGLALLPAMAHAEDSLPPRPASAPAYGDAVPLYDRYDAEAYSVDSQISTLDPAGRAVHHATNLLLIGKAWLVKLAVRAAEYAVTGDLFATLTSRATAVMTGLQAWLWESGRAPLVVGALSLAGLWALILALAGRMTRALESLGSTALVLLISLGLMGVLPTAFPSLQESTRAVAAQSLGVVATASGSGDATGLITAAGSAAWDALVHKPWLAAEFTDQRAADAYSDGQAAGGRILRMRPSQRLRMYMDPNQFPNDPARNAYFGPWTEDALIRRALMATWTLGAGAAFALSVLLLAGGVLAFQLTLLAVVMLLPLWLLAALWWPGGGVRLLRRILAIGLGALLWQVVLAITLAVTLGLALGVGTLLPDAGWALQSMLLAALGLAAHRYRYDWLRGLGLPVQAPAGIWMLPAAGRVSPTGPVVLPRRPGTVEFTGGAGTPGAAAAGVPGSEPLLPDFAALRRIGDAPNPGPLPWKPAAPVASWTEWHREVLLSQDQPARTADAVQDVPAPAPAVIEAPVRPSVGQVEGRGAAAERATEGEIPRQRPRL